MATGADRPHLLFFTSPRSGPGRRMESLLAHVARRERTRLRVSRVNVEDASQLAERLGVTEIPTLLLLVAGRPAGRIEGRASAPQIDRLLGEHLERGNPNRTLAA